jgi:hypothetical protein
VGSLLIWLSGARPDILRQFPAQRGKYLGVGSAILITASIAAVSMTFALHTALRAPLYLAIPAALAWGLAILTLDRWLVVSLQRQDHPWRYALLAVPRVLLAVLFGFIISTPFVLQIFRPEIEQQITQIQSHRSDAYFAHLSSDPLTRRINNEQAQVAKLQSTIEAGGAAATNPYQDPTVSGLVRQRSATLRQEKADYGQWQCQLYGISQGTKCKRGQGPLAAASKQRYLNDVALVRQENTQIKAAVQRVLAQQRAGDTAAVGAARTALPHARQRLNTDVHEQGTLTESFNNKNASSAGLLLRLQALSDATAHNGTLNAARWLLFALFTTIECLPILVKTLLNLGPPNAYEQMVTDEERRAARAAEEEDIRLKAARVIQADAVLDEAKRMAESRGDMIPEITQEAIAAERRVAMAMIVAWEQREMSNIGQNGRPPRSRAFVDPDAGNSWTRRNSGTRPGNGPSRNGQAREAPPGRP